MKKILRIITRLNVGGPALHINNLVDLPGYETLVVYGSLSENESLMKCFTLSHLTYEEHIPELQREINFKKDLIAYYKLCKIIRNYKPDIIHTHTSKAGLLGRTAAFTTSTAKVVHTFHGHTFHSYFSPRKEFVFRNLERMLAVVSDKIIVLSETQRTEISQALRQDTNKFQIIKLGFDLEKFTNIVRIKNKYITVGIIGRLTSIKNHKMFIKAINNLSDEILQKFHFRIIGDGELKKELMQFVINLGIRSYVSFAGNVVDMTTAYELLDYVVCTSLNEGTPVSLIEAMASGVPVISTDVGGVPDLLGKKLYEKNGYYVCESGLLFPSNRDDILTSIFEDMSENKAGICDTMLFNAHCFVSRNYNKTRLRSEMVDLYNNLLERK